MNSAWFGSLMLASAASLDRYRCRYEEIGFLINFNVPLIKDGIRRIIR